MQNRPRPHLRNKVEKTISEKRRGQIHKIDAKHQKRVALLPALFKTSQSPSFRVPVYPVDQRQQQTYRQSGEDTSHRENYDSIAARTKDYDSTFFDSVAVDDEVNEMDIAGTVQSAGYHENY